MDVRRRFLFASGTAEVWIARGWGKLRFQSGSSVSRSAGTAKMKSFFHHVAGAKRNPGKVTFQGFEVAAEGFEPDWKKTGFAEHENKSGPPGGPLLDISEIAEALSGLSPEALKGIAALASVMKRNIPESANIAGG